MDEIKQSDARYVLNTYGRHPEANLLICKGNGTRVWDDNGKEYLDLVGGLAVNALGHCHPKVVDAIKEQAETLIHTSNLYYNDPQARLARVLANSSLKGKVFFCNSGAEANEAAIKMARKYSQECLGQRRYQIITALRSFHGRSLATISATAQSHYHKGFEPLVEGFIYAPFNDLDAFKRAAGKETCAIMVEPVQGEGGVYPADPDFLKGLRQLCDENGILLVFDEIQCGMGRTGSLWAYQEYGVEPDILTSAKALGGGLPIGALMCREKVSSGLGPGDHASTFGGNPVTCRAALAVMEALLDDGVLDRVKTVSALFLEELGRVQEEIPGSIEEIRGKGLMIAMETHEPGAKQLQKELLKKGFIVNSLGNHVIRLLPPLVITEEEITSFVAALKEILKAWS